MRETVVIENIEEMRNQAGIDDVELRSAIPHLQVGSQVKLTFLSGSNRPRSETLEVRITRIDENGFRGKLVKDPTYLPSSKLRAGKLITFTKDNIHSIAKSKPVANH